MTEWPKNPERIAGDNPPLEPVGPLNVFNEKLAHADAINHAHVVKAAYDKNAEPKSVPQLPVVVTPTGTPAGAGRAIPYEAARYMVDVMLPSPSYVRRRR